MTQNCETASSPDTACNRDCSLPSILYKYFSSARLDVLAERSVRFTQPGDFNDPFEFRPRIQAAAHEHEVRTHVENNFDRLIDQELNKYGALVPPELLDAVRAAAHDQKFLVPGTARNFVTSTLASATMPCTEPGPADATPPSASTCLRSTICTSSRICCPN